MYIYTYITLVNFIKLSTLVLQDLHLILAALMSSQRAKKYITK